MTSEPTVFIVDDNVAVRKSLRALLESAGLAVETYASGEEFLVPKWHLGMQAGFRSLASAIDGPGRAASRKRSFQDIGIPKCNLGTRG